MKIALAQLNYTIGDIDANADRIIESIHKAKAEGADLVLFAEYAVSGTPAYDLLRKTTFLSLCEEALERIAAACKNITAIVGSPVLTERGAMSAAMVMRNGEKVLLDDFHLVKGQFPDGNGGTSLRYGFSFTLEDATFTNKLSYVWNTAMNTVRTVRLSLQMLLTGQAGLADMSGPVGIVQMMSETAESSPTKLDALLNMLYFGGFIAINLAIMNMLPIPALDGGRVLALLVTTLIVKITKKPVNSKVESYIHAGGMILLLILMAVIMFKDVFMIFKG